ncbi:hypothetical protein GG344DRAFT_69913 [Lentinula edodes]|nr:hypothetical protein GG344DRAFT_69913 [Lentinula edodes]
MLYGQWATAKVKHGSMDSDTLKEELQLKIVTYVTISFLALLVEAEFCPVVPQIYDWFISLSREVIRVWQSKWSLVKVLYLYTRYAPFIVMAISAQDDSSLNKYWDKIERVSFTCNKMTFTTSMMFFEPSVQSVFAGFTIGISDLILMLRTYSIYNKSRRVLAIFGLSWVPLFLRVKVLEVHHLVSCPIINPDFISVKLLVWYTVKVGDNKTYIELTLNNSVAGFLALLDALVLHVRDVSKHRMEDDDGDDEDDVLPTFIIVTVMEPYMSKQPQQHYL